MLARELNDKPRGQNSVLRLCKFRLYEGEKHDDSRF